MFRGGGGSIGFLLADLTLVYLLDSVNNANIRVGNGSLR